MTSFKNNPHPNHGNCLLTAELGLKHTENIMFPLLSLGCQIPFKPSDYQSCRNLALQQPHTVLVKPSSLLNFRAIPGTDFPSEIFTFREIRQSDFGACLLVVQICSLGFYGPLGRCTCRCCEKVFLSKLSVWLGSLDSQFQDFTVDSLNCQSTSTSRVTCRVKAILPVKSMQNRNYSLLIPNSFFSHSRSE